MRATRCGSSLLANHSHLLHTPISLSFLFLFTLLLFISADAFQSISSLRFICLPAPPPLRFSLPLLRFSPVFFPTSPSLFHLIALILPGDRRWTERFPLSYKSREWLTALSALPKLSRQHPPLPPVCTVEAEEVCKTTLLSLLLTHYTLAHRDREDGLSWRQKAGREARLCNKGSIGGGEGRQVFLKGFSVTSQMMTPMGRGMPVTVAAFQMVVRVKPAPPSLF